MNNYHRTTEQRNKSRCPGLRSLEEQQVRLLDISCPLELLSTREASWFRRIRSNNKWESQRNFDGSRVAAAMEKNVKSLEEFSVHLQWSFKAKSVSETCEEKSPKNFVATSMLFFQGMSTYNLVSQKTPWTSVIEITLPDRDSKRRHQCFRNRTKNGSRSRLSQYISEE